MQVSEFMYKYANNLGAIQKICHARGGEGVCEGVTVCDGGSM